MVLGLWRCDACNLLVGALVVWNADVVVGDLSSIWVVLIVLVCCFLCFCYCVLCLSLLTFVGFGCCIVDLLCCLCMIWCVFCCLVCLLVVMLVGLVFCGVWMFVSLVGDLVFWCLIGGSLRLSLWVAVWLVAWWCLDVSVALFGLFGFVGCLVLVGLEVAGFGGIVGVLTARVSCLLLAVLFVCGFCVCGVDYCVCWLRLGWLFAVNSVVMVYSVLFT